MNTTRVIWEGWTAQDFIDELELLFKRHTPFETKAQLKKWCKENQPYYKKHIPEVYACYLKKANL